MNSNRPYLIRALYDWIYDNHLTPYLLVDTSSGDLNIPQDFVENNRIVLNISPSAIRDLDLGNHFIQFKARFSGQNMTVYFPVQAVLAIYAKENGRGMLFPGEELQERTEKENISGEIATEIKEQGNKEKRPHLRVIK